MPSIKSRRRSSGGDGRHKLCQSDQAEPTRHSRVSPPPAREQTATPGRHRPDAEDSDSDSTLGGPDRPRALSATRRVRYSRRDTGDPFALPLHPPAPLLNRARMAPRERTLAGPIVARGRWLPARRLGSGRHSDVELGLPQSTVTPGKHVGFPGFGGRTPRFGGSPRPFFARCGISRFGTGRGGLYIPAHRTTLAPITGGSAQ